jgi:4-amino-4-deoxy-L-arabinose transferase-like glycosyltransferase
MMTTRRKSWTVVFLLALFLAAFIPRALYPVSRPLQWYERSFRFIDAVLRGQWAEAIVSEHPGVTPMWLIGLAQHGYCALLTALGTSPPHPLDIANRAFQTEVAVSVFPLALAIALGVLVIWWLLRNLFGETVAWAGAGFLALDPFHIAISKVVHVDALLSVLMILSALTLLVHLRRSGGSEQGRSFWPRYGWLLASGVLAGLAFLTKSPAYFLVPFLGLSLLVARGRARLVRGYLVPVLLWAGAAAITYGVVWPAMWVQPAQTLATVIGGVFKHTGRAHPQPLYYLGELTTEDPGLGFYGVALLVKTTVLSLPLFVIGLVGPLTAMWRRERRSLGLLVAYFAFFFVQMGLGAKKAPRYLLPAFPALDIIAGVGLVTLARRLASWKARVPCGAFVAVALLAQAALVWLYHPYTITHASLLVGGPAGARRYLLATPEGEGLDLVAEYANRLPGAGQLRVGVQLPAREAFRQYFVGEVTDTRESDLDYLVFTEVYVRRRMAEDQWGEQWETYKYRVPEYTAYLHGQPYAWLYRVADGPQQPAVPLQVCLGERLRLLGYTAVVDGSTARTEVGARSDGRAIQPGDSLRLTLHWAATESPEGDYSVFVHLLGPERALVAQQDNPPLGGTYPTFLWGAGERVDDPYELTVPPDAPPGRYTVVAGMYDWRTGERLTTLGECASPLPENRIVLTALDVRPEGAPWWQVLAWMLAGTLGVGGVGLCLTDVRWDELRQWWRTIVAAFSSFLAPVPSPAPLSVGWQDGLLILAVMALALAARLPYLMQIPRLGDEVFEALQALSIARGEIKPVVGVNALFGPLFAYLLALCFWLFGASPLVPRALATATGVVTVGLTYLLARRQLRSRGAAALAAALMATTPTYILVNGHIGYSNSTTPMLTTAMLLASVVAAERHSGPLLVLGGFLAGLSLQTHLSIVPLLAGMVVWFLAQRRGRRWLRTKWPYLALAAAIVAYSPVIWFNLRTGFATLSEPAAHPYAYTGRIGLARYLENLRLLIWELTWMVSGRMSLRPELTSFLLMGAVRLGWLVVGLVYALRRRDGLLFASLLSTMALMPAFNNLYSRTMGTRYIVWLLPVVYTGLAALVPPLLRRLYSRLGSVLVGVCAVALVFLPVVPLGMYYSSHQARHRTNEDLLRFAQTIGREPGPSSLVVIDEGVDLLYLSNAGTVLSAMDYLLTLQETPHVVVASDRVIETIGREKVPPVWLITEWEEGMTAVEVLGLKPVDSGIIGGEPEYRLGLFLRPE